MINTNFGISTNANTDNTGKIGDVTLSFNAAQNPLNFSTNTYTYSLLGPNATHAIAYTKSFQIVGYAMQMEFLSPQGTALTMGTEPRRAVFNLRIRATPYTAPPFVATGSSGTNYGCIVNASSSAMSAGATVGILITGCTIPNGGNLDVAFAMKGPYNAGDKYTFSSQ